jgi:hypothetical protein
METPMESFDYSVERKKGFDEAARRQGVSDSGAEFLSYRFLVL